VSFSPSPSTKSRETRIDPENFPRSLVAGGQVSRVDPESTGLNPAWRKSLALASIGTTWQEGANLTEIQAARRLLIQDMKILEGLAPESGAYLNEVRLNHIPSHPHSLQPHFLFFRLRDTNSTGRNRSSALTTTHSEPSSGSTIRNHSSSFTKVSDQTSGTQISSAEYETPLNPPIDVSFARSMGGCGF